jgi:hypothetical protein
MGAILNWDEHERKKSGIMTSVMGREKRPVPNNNGAGKLTTRELWNVSMHWRRIELHSSLERTNRAGSEGGCDGCVSP